MRYLDIFEKDQFGKNTNVGVTSYPGFRPHFQDSIELFYLKSGNYKVKINGREYDLHGGDVAVVLPYQIHEYINVDSTNKELVILLNTNLLTDYKNKLDSCEFEYPIIRKDQMPQQLVNLFLNFENIGLHGNTESELTLIRKHLGNAVMWYIFKIMPYKKNESGRLSVIQQVTQFIYENYSNTELSLEMVAKKIGYNSTYISNAISNCFGVNFKSVVNTIRLSEAKRLLMFSDKSITEICYQCGFNSVRTFNRIFFRFEKVSPREYREKYGE